MSTIKPVHFAVKQYAVTLTPLNIDLAVGESYLGNELKGTYGKIIVINLAIGKNLGIRFNRGGEADIAAMEGTIFLPGGGVHTENVFPVNYISLVASSTPLTAQLIFYRGGDGSA